MEVPVGENQDQHLELARTLARRLNRRYGATLGVPVGVRPFAGTRIMNLADPSRKMDKSNPSPAGVLFVLDPPEAVRRKVGRSAATAYSSNSRLKSDLTEAVIAVRQPLREAYREIRSDPAELRRVLAGGADRARALAAPTLAAIQDALGLLPPG